MKSFILFFMVSCFVMRSYSQEQQKVVDTTQQSEQYWKAWRADLYNMGPAFIKDSFIVSPELKKAMVDAKYRALLYPNKYTWQDAISLMNGMELKKAFWYMIKLYNCDTANRRFVAGTLLAFDKKLEMDRALTAAFYTYAFADPLVCLVKDGKPDITRPDIIQDELSTVKLLCAYIRQKREVKN